MKFGNVCSLWYCWMCFGLNFVSIEVMKILCVGLVEQIYFWWMQKFLLECVKSYFMSKDIFMDMSVEIFFFVVVWIFCVRHEKKICVKHGQILVGHWRIFVGHEILVGTKIFGHRRIFFVRHGILVGTNLWTWENFC